MNKTNVHQYFLTVKGMTLMNYSEEISSFCGELVSNYCVYDEICESYTIDIDSISDQELQHLCSLIIIKNKSLAFESNSIENDEFEKSMLPALIESLKNASNKEKQHNFSTLWKNGIVSYFRKKIIELLDDALDEYEKYMAA